MKDSGAVEFARLGDKVVIAEWRKQKSEHETTIEWQLTLDGRPFTVRDAATGAPTFIALHRWEEGHERAREAILSDGRWAVEIPIAWHSMCAAFSGSLHLQFDLEKMEIDYRDDIHVEL